MTVAHRWRPPNIETGCIRSADGQGIPVRSRSDGRASSTDGAGHCAQRGGHGVRRPAHGRSALYTADSDPFAARMAFVRDGAGDRFDELELNISVIGMPTDDSGVPDLSIARRSLPNLSEDEMLMTPTVLSGSTKEIADTIRGY